MKIYLCLFVITLLTLSCSKKADETASSSNIATAVVSNLTNISANYNPNSLDSATSFVDSNGVQVYADPCQGVTDFAICQSNLIREYLKIGKNTVDTLAELAGAIGGALGQVPDGNAGTSEDGKISWSKTSSSVWSILSRGTLSQSEAYFSVNDTTYTLKIDQSVDVADPSPMQAEATVTYTDENNWSVDVFFSNTDCSATDVGAPSKVQIKVARTNGLWTGKAMLYAPRFEAPGETVTCGTSAGTHEIAMYTDFVGNDTSTKAALYLIPAATASLATIGNFDLMDFCTNFASYCGGAGEPTGGFLASYPNNWCTTGPGTNPTWGDNCTSNTDVSGASFSNSTDWVMPNALKVKTTTLPTSL